MNVMKHKNFRNSVPGEAVACDKYIIQGGPASVKINKMDNFLWKF